MVMELDKEVKDSGKVAQMIFEGQKYSRDEIRPIAYKTPGLMDSLKNTLKKGLFCLKRNR